MSVARTIAQAVEIGERTEPEKGFCRWCGGPVVKPRRTFCSGSAAEFVRRLERGKPRRILAIVDGTGTGCAHEFLIRSRPGYARKCVEVRDQGVCAICGAKAHSFGWHMDHILPVVEGGGLAGLENLRTLCTACHKTETAKLAGRRARARAEGPAVVAATGEETIAVNDQNKEAVL